MNELNIDIFSEFLFVFWDNLSVFFFSNCLLNSLQNNRYSVRRQEGPSWNYFTASKCFRTWEIDHEQCPPGL